MLLGVSQDGEGRVRGGVYAPQLLESLPILLQPLNRSLKAVREGQRGEGGGLGKFGLEGEKKTYEMLKCQAGAPMSNSKAIIWKIQRIHKKSSVLSHNTNFFFTSLFKVDANSGA